MIARVTYGLVSAWPFQHAKVARGETVTVNLHGGVPPGLSWPSDPDQVLSIVTAPDGKSAEITATAVGFATIEIQRGVGTRPLLILTFEVFKDTSDEAAYIDGEFGPEELAED